jgi:hypothetical protein
MWATITNPEKDLNVVFSSTNYITPGSVWLFHSQIGQKWLRQHHFGIISLVLIVCFQIHRNHRYIEGVRVKYRAVADAADLRKATSLRSRRGDIMTSLVPTGTTTFVLRSLHKYTWFVCWLQWPPIAGQTERSSWCMAKRAASISHLSFKAASRLSEWFRMLKITSSW